MKTSAVKVKSSFRYFYYTNSGKIKAVARHLLLDISVSQESKGYWKIDDWALSDLSKLNVHLKNEFNASKSDITDVNARIMTSL
jgi:hypothetical protein